MWGELEIGVVGLWEEDDHIVCASPFNDTGLAHELRTCCQSRPSTSMEEDMQVAFVLLAVIWHVQEIVIGILGLVSSFFGRINNHQLAVTVVFSIPGSESLSVQVLQVVARKVVITVWEITSCAAALCSGVLRGGWKCVGILMSIRLVILVVYKCALLSEPRDRATYQIFRNNGVVGASEDVDWFVSQSISGVRHLRTLAITVI